MNNETLNYCREKGVRICLEDLDTCPFREKHKNNNFCNFVNFLMEYYLEKRYREDISYYLSSACSNIRQTMLEHENDCREANERKIKIKKAKIGAKVFCIPENSYGHLLKKDIGITKLCLYRNVDGVERVVFPYDLSVVSDGDSVAIFNSKFKEYNEIFEFRAKALGFRVEREENGDYIIYKIYGDLQKEVDDFIKIYCKDNKKKN